MSNIGNRLYLIRRSPRRNCAIATGNLARMQRIAGFGTPLRFTEEDIAGFTRDHEDGRWDNFLCP